MDLFSLSELLGGKCQPNNFEVGNVRLDVKKVGAGDVFFALKHLNYDNYSLIESAIHQGACAIVTEYELSFPVATIIVDNGYASLIKLAIFKRLNYFGQVVAITGSCGKTTTKGFVSNILSLYGKTLCTDGNANDDIGAVLTLLDIDNSFDYVIFEVGASKPGDIESLSRLIKPTISVITNIKRSHLDHFATLEDIYYEKLNIHMHSEGIRIINGDDRFCFDFIFHNLDSSFYLFSATHNNFCHHFENYIGQVYVGNVNVSTKGFCTFDLMIPPEFAIKDIRLNVPGRHNLNNALAAASVGLALKIPPDIVRKGLEGFLGAPGRVEIKYLKSGAILIDDTFNSSIDSFIAAIEIVKNFSNPLVICSSLGECGLQSNHLHFLLGQLVKENGIQNFYVCGSHTSVIASGYGPGITIFTSQKSMFDYIRSNGIDADVVLVKGSRYSKMDRLVNALMEME